MSHQKYTPNENDLINMQIAEEDHTQAILEAIDDAKKRGLVAIGMAAKGHAKKNAPVRTGRLRNSITWTTDDNIKIIFEENTLKQEENNMADKKIQCGTTRPLMYLQK